MISTYSLIDYTPCSYTLEDVECDQVPLEEVQKVFKRNYFTKLISVKLILQRISETFIPENVFETKQILDILIDYPNEVHPFTTRSLDLQVDADAFQSTKSYTNNFTIDNIDCTLLDLKFLTGFAKLTRLVFSNIHNIQHC